MTSEAYKWDQYAVTFAEITSRYQREMYEYAVNFLCGSVLDCGCGAGKLIPYLADKKEVASYLGVDTSKPMTVQAGKLLTKLNKPDFKVLNQAIECTTGLFTSAVSLQSYYCWPDSGLILQKIFNLLSPNGVFVLASVNEKLDIHRLLHKASYELLMHHNWDAYAVQNVEFAQSSSTKLITLDEFIGEVRNVGFKVVETQTKLFEGGLNLLVLQK